jgi:hypothetical protein
MLAEGDSLIWIAWVILGLAIVTMLILLFQLDERTRDTHRALKEIRDIVRRLEADDARRPQG